jgi:hypothetical protein
VTRYFAPGFFHETQSPENNIRVISNFVKKSWRYSQVKLQHQYQRHQWQIAAGVNDTDGSVNQQTPMSNFSTGIAGVSDTGAMSKIPAKNFVAGVNVTGGELPLVAMTPAVN